MKRGILWAVPGFVIGSAIVYAVAVIPYRHTLHEPATQYVFLGGLAGAMLSVLLKFYGRSVRMVPAREYPFTLKLAIALLFAMFCLFLAFWVAAVSFHGGPIWARLGLGYGVAAMVALWVSYRRTAGTALFVLAAISIAGAIVPVVGAIFMYQDWQVKRSRAEDNRIEISDLRAEMLRSGAGNPIGIRLRFEARFPKDREYWLVPSVKADEPRDFEFRTMTAREEASPRVIKWFAPEHFEARKAYRLVYEFVPFFVTWEPWNGGEYREGATL